MEQLLSTTTKHAPLLLPQLSQLEEAILQTVSYGDIFAYPVTLLEIHRYLEGIKATEQEVADALANGRLLPHYLAQKDGFYTLAGHQEIVAVREQRRTISKTLWPAAVRYGRFIARLPFVRMVTITGSLAMNNVTEEADIDYLIVTENGRLWLTRAFIITIVRLAARQGLILCPNYILTRRALQFSDENLYTARELAQMIPLSGINIYWQMRQSNTWADKRLPNATTYPKTNVPISQPSWFQKLLELPFRTPLGNWLESWEMNRKVNKFQQQLNNNETSFCPDWCKGHFDGHQENTLFAYESRLRQ